MLELELGTSVCLCMCGRPVEMVTRAVCWKPLHRYLDNLYALQQAWKDDLREFLGLS